MYCSLYKLNCHEVETKQKPSLKHSKSIKYATSVINIILVYKVIIFSHILKPLSATTDKSIR